MTVVDNITEEAPSGAAISVEALAYGVLLIVGAVLRLLWLPPLDGRGAYEAVAAWRALYASVPGEALAPHSPMGFASNVLLQSLFGQVDLAAFGGVLIAGIALVLLPLLWRRSLGGMAALIMAGLLTISASSVLPVRAAHPAVFAAVLAMLTMWAGKRALSRPHGSVIFAVLAALLILGVGPSGALTGLCIVIGVLFAAWSGRESPFRAALPDWIANFPAAKAALFAAGALFVVGTVFFLHPPGLGAVGQVISDTVSGIGAAPPKMKPAAWALLSFVFYNPLIAFMGLIGLLLVARHGGSFARMLAGWAASGAVIALVYGGLEPAHTLPLLAVPMAALSGIALERLLAFRDSEWNPPGWALPLQIAWVVGLLFAAGLSGWILSQRLPGIQSFEALTAMQNLQPFALSVLTLGMIAILFFLAGSLWGAASAGRGLILGIAAFLVLSTISATWQTGLFAPGDPDEMWYHEPLSHTLPLLDESLDRVAERVSGERTLLEMVVALDDPALAWMLRSRDGIRYVDDIGAVQGAPPVLLAPESQGTGGLAAEYTGQDFTLRWTQEFTALPVDRWLQWGLMHESPWGERPDERVILWVRTDVYGIPPEQPDSETDSEMESGAESELEPMGE